LEIVEWDFNRFLESQDLWNETLRASADGEVFLRWEWLANWWKRFGPRGKSSVIIAQDGDRVLAAAPLICKDVEFLGLRLARLQFIASEASDYLAFLIVDKGLNCVERILDYAVSKTPLLELGGIPEDSSTAKALREISRRFMFDEGTHSVCPYALLPRKWEDYLTSLGSSFRRKLLRTERLLRKEHDLNFRICTRAEEVGEAMNILFELHERRQGRRGIFANQETRDFHLDVASSFASKGLIMIGLLELDDEPVAANEAFTYKARVYGYISGMAPECSKHSVGSILQMHMIRYCIEQGLKEYDFLSGNEAYKTQWSSLVRRTVRFRGGRGPISTLYKFAARKRESIITSVNSLRGLGQRQPLT
jgi:CelD/BcsL family acetyltransferase involved in cellulose biosynthesis